jgi:NAD(P)-dependent dehydrogenase (short-subunit alcohol dehydrogenase family)
MRMNGKVGVVTGAAQGLGRETLDLLLREGAKVVAVDIDADQGAATVAELDGDGNAVFQPGDVTREEDIVAAISRAREEFGGFDFIHNNAGIQVEKPLLDTTNEDFDRLVAVNLRGVFWGCKRAVEAMLETGGGSIVNTASLLSLTGDPFLPAYTATKHGVLGLTRAIGGDPDYAQAGIRCNCVCPGDMETPMIQRYWDATPDPAAARASMEGAYPAKRIGHPREVAQAVLFLASDESSYLNGSYILADGGLTAKPY